MYKRNCITCQKTRGNPKLRGRIYHAQFLRENGDETIAQIAVDVGISEPAVRNHATRHMKLRSTGLEEAKTTKNIETIKAKIAKETELSFDHEDVVPKQDFEMVVDSVLAEGLQQLKQQDKQISISQLLTAAKIKADYTSKKRGQDTEIIKTMYRMASGGRGELSGQDKAGDNTSPTGEVDKAGKDRPGHIHQPFTWDALAPGPDTVSQAD